MQRDQQRVEEAKAWFTKADHDLLVAQILLTTGPRLFDNVVFHAQQVAEKAIKGFLSWHDCPFRKTHNSRVPQEVRP
jgi:HEPN domain-containing protein